MIPLMLAVRNFLCYRDNVPPLDLRGIHVACLCGPNGHGKSALLDAMTWCLWGHARTGSRNHNSLIAYGETECRVELDFEAGERTFRAVRRRRSVGQGRTELDLFVLDTEEQPRPITGNTLHETSARIRDLVGMDYETFVNSAFVVQGRSDEFTRKTPSERKDVLSSILGLELYDALQAATRSRRSEWQDRANRYEGALTQAMSALEAIPDPSGELAEIDRRLAQVSADLESATREAQRRRAAVGDLSQKRSQLDAGKKRLAELRNDLERAEAHALNVEQRIAAAKALEARHDEIGEGVRRLAEAREELDRLEAIRRESDRLHRERNELLLAIGRAHATLSSECAELERRITRDLQPQATRSATIARELAQLERDEAQLVADEHALRRQADELADVAAGIAARTGELERCVAEGKALRARQTEMSTAGGEDALCPLCRTPLSEDACDNIAEWYEAEIGAKLDQYQAIQSLLADLNDRHQRLSRDAEAGQKSLAERQRLTQQQRGRLEQERRRCEEAAQQLEQLAPRLSSTRERLESERFALPERETLQAVESQIAPLGYEESRREKYYGLVQSLQHWELEETRLNQASAQLPSDLQDLDASRLRIDTLRGEITGTEKSIAADREALEGLPEMEIAACEQESAVVRLSEERDELLAGKGRLQGDADRRQAHASEAERLRRSHGEAQAEQGIYSDLITAFGRGGVPAMLIDAAVPHLENEANHLLGRMTDNRLAIKMETQRVNQGGNTSETLDILISDELGARSYELFSGGEAFRINLALRIALSKVLSQRLGAPLPTLFIDEGFGTQDALGRERIVDAIASIQDEFEKIIVITHLEDLKDLFPARIEVLKTQAGSQFWLS